MRSLQLGSRLLTLRSKPYVIAEIGVNHEGSMDLAKRLIDQAKQGGADAAKFQSYKADTLASKHSPAYWDINKEPTQSQHQLFRLPRAGDVTDDVIGSVVEEAPASADREPARGPFQHYPYWLGQ